MNNYQEMKQKHEKEFNDFPMFFAFSNAQFEKAMAVMGLKVTDTDKIYKTPGGGFYKRTDSARLSEMLDSHTADMDNAIEADKTGEGFIFEMFDYELANHEFCYTGDTEDTLNVFGYSQEDINKDKALYHGLKLAIKANWEEN